MSDDPQPHRFGVEGASGWHAVSTRLQPRDGRGHRAGAAFHGPRGRRSRLRRSRGVSILVANRADGACAPDVSLQGGARRALRRAGLDRDASPRQDARGITRRGSPRDRGRGLRLRGADPSPGPDAARRFRRRRPGPVSLPDRRLRGGPAFQLSRDDPAVDVPARRCGRQHVRAQTVGPHSARRPAAGRAVSPSGLSGGSVERGPWRG